MASSARLSREELRALHRRYRETTDAAERDRIRAQLVDNYHDFVYFLARKFANRGEPLEDIAQVGYLGLIKAIERFDPERFSSERSQRRADFAYLPFGGGPRICIGNTFATTEAQLVVATMAQRYLLRIVPGHPVELHPLITLRPRHGIRMTLHPADDDAAAAEGARGRAAR